MKKKISTDTYMLMQATIMAGMNASGLEVKTKHAQNQIDNLMKLNECEVENTVSNIEFQLGELCNEASHIRQRL